MASRDEIAIVVKAEVDKAIGNLKRVNTSTDKIDKKSGGLFKSLKAGWLGVSAAVAAAAAVLTKYVGAAVKAFAVQEKAEKTLAAAMKNAGTFTEAAYQAALRYASALQQVTIFGDEAILGVQRLLTNFGIEGEMLDKLTKASLDLAAAKGIDLKTAADLVAKSVGSSTNALSRYGATIEGAANSTDRAQMAVDEISRLFGGAATAEAETFAGQIQQLQNEFGDLQEAVGEGFAPTIKSFTSSLRGIRGVEKGFRAVTVAVAGLLLGIRLIGSANLLMYKILLAPVELIIRSIIVLANVVKDIKENGFEGLGKEGLDALKSLGKETANYAKSFVNPFKSSIEDFFETIKDGQLEVESVLTKNSESVDDANQTAQKGSQKTREAILDEIDARLRLLDTAKKLGLSEKQLSGLTEEQVKFRVKLAGEEAKAREKEAEKIKQAQEALLDAGDDVSNALIDLAKEVSSRELRATLDRLEREKQARLAAAQERIDIENMAQMRLDEISSAETNERLDKIKLERDAAIEAGDEALAAELGRQVAEIEAREEAAARKIEIEKELAAASAEIEADIAEKKSEAELKAFRASKQSSIIDSIINTAVGFTKALAGPFPSNLINAAAVSAAGLTQTGIIASQPTPAFADGGFTPPTATIATVGERGREFVMPADLTSRMVAAIESGVVGGGKSIQIGEVKFDSYDAFESYLSRYYRENGRLA